MKCCVIVDGCSTGKYLAPILKTKGYQCIHVQSHSKPYQIEHGGANPNDYLVSYVYDGNFSKLVNFLEEYAPEFIIPGSEPGVELANDLALKMNLFPNAPHTGKVCRDKYLMQEALKKAGLPHIKQFLATDLASAVNWARNHNNWPIIIKPVDSGGGDGIFICEDEEDLKIAYKTIIGTPNIFEKINTQVLVQEFIEGEEYAVNTISSESHHYLESVFKQKKIKLSNGHLIYDSSTLISTDEVPYFHSLKSSIFKSLDALGLKYGASHCEVIMSPKGPILIECAARLMGGTLPPKIMSLCLGINQPELLVDSYIDSNSFIQNYSKTHYKIKKHLCVFYFKSKKTGRIKNIKFLNALNSLPSMSLLRMNLKEGDFLKRTIDLPSAAGDAFLVNSKKEDLNHDYEKIKYMEIKGLFTFAQEKAVSAKV